MRSWIERNFINPRGGNYGVVSSIIKYGIVKTKKIIKKMIDGRTAETVNMTDDIGTVLYTC